MSLDYKIFFEPRGAEEKLLAATPTAEVVATLLKLFDVLLRDSYVDPEMLEFDGLAVSRTGHRRVDVALAGWLGPSPGERRLELVAWFLYGYWRMEGAVASDTLVTELLAALGALPFGQQPYVGVVYSLLTAHTSASLPAPLAATVKAALGAERAKLAGTGLAEGLQYNLAAV